MKTKKEYLLFDKIECQSFIDTGLDNFQLGEIFLALCKDFVGQDREALLNQFKDCYARSFMIALFASQDARRQEYKNKCDSNRKNILKRWEKDHPGVPCPYADDFEETETESPSTNKQNPYKRLIQH